MEDPKSVSAPLPEKPKTSWLLVVLIALSSLLFLAAAIYIAYTYGARSQQGQWPGLSPAPTSLPTSVSTPAPASSYLLEERTQDWETYRNEEYKFEFKYPERYKLRGRLVEEKFKDNYQVPTEDDLLNISAVEIVKKIYKFPAQEPRIELHLISTSETVEDFIQRRQQKLEEMWPKFISGLPMYADAEKPGILSVSDYQGRFIKAKRTKERGYPNAPNQNYLRFYFRNNGLLFILSGNYGTVASDTTGERGLDEKETTVDLFNTFKFID